MAAFVYELSQEVLRTDAAGMPLEWIGYEDAVKLYYLEQVAYSCGTLLYRLHGGICAKTGQQSTVDVNSIIATYGNNHALAKARAHYIPPLNNHTLFKRDANLCMYCGQRFSARELSREHVTPLSRGGTDTWNNVVAACKRCNNHKAGRTPEESSLQLLAVPFTPNHAEYIFLKGRRILADQMEFLLAHFPRTSPLHKRIAQMLA
ncbi:MAG TPA: HNH endonuclease [Gammaproteobacteria bacterium]|nr:HNH endonuclease [Gammaproteobacteria bacterium]